MCIITLAFILSFNFLLQAFTTPAFSTSCTKGLFMVKKHLGFQTLRAQTRSIKNKVTRQVFIEITKQQARCWSEFHASYR
jgi:hypothetical protein